ncbi:MAG: Fe-S oxidoreductase [Firmicutes bacterium]|nr:Fe-S oxidoreductase [Bacillota bacterium]
MSNKIAKIISGSIAEELEIEVGDNLISINGTEIKDIIDYKFLMADDYIEVEIEKENGEIWTFEVEKEYQEDLGIEFENGIIDEARSCHNKCLFCFIDQLPKGMRKTLYFKDDDSRLSFLQGNFVTLTNMTDADLERIIRYRISPINVSVHTTNAELRKRMLNNRFAGTIYERLEKLAAAGINMNCQIVLCPGYNNGEELIKTVNDLYKLYPSVENVAAVPVAVTKFRKNIKEITLYDAESAKAEIDNVSKFQQKALMEIGTPFIRLADEFYVLSGSEIPDTEFYGDFDQIEDGIGMVRFFRDSITKNLKKINMKGKGSFSLITGVSAYNEILWAAKAIEKRNDRIIMNVHKVINNFFEPTITVAGLLTGQDVMKQIQPDSVLEYIIMPKNMFKSDENIMLDDITAVDLERYFNKKILICDFTGEDLIRLVNEHI